MKEDNCAPILTMKNQYVRRRYGSVAGYIVRQALGKINKPLLQLRLEFSQMSSSNVGRLLTHTIDLVHDTAYYHSCVVVA